MVLEKQVTRFLNVCGFKTVIKLQRGELRLHRIGTDFRVEFWEEGDFSHIIETFFNEDQANDLMVKIALSEYDKVVEDLERTQEDD